MLNVLKNYKIWFAISGTFLVIGLFSVFSYGMKLGIDFTGGSIIELSFKANPNLDQIKLSLKNLKLENSQLQTTQANGVIIKTHPLQKAEFDNLISELNQQVEVKEVLKFETIGPIIGKELKTKAIYQLFLVCMGILIYIGYAFRKVTKPVSSWKFGISAVLAMFHDTLVLLGSFSLLGWLYGVQVDVLFVTAVLTTLSFSVHDTIVVFDRIRELKRKHYAVPTQTLTNAAVLETMSRSINNSVTIIVMLLALSLLGGETIRWFAVALLIGSITGTYSSTFTAVPLLLLWDDIAAWRKKAKLR
jgi:preprotein translocase subunit SecF